MKTSAQEIASLISSQFACEVGDIVGNEALFSEGLLDSFNLVELVTELEGRYSIRINAMEINLENFDSVQSIAELINRKADD